MGWMGPRRIYRLCSGRAAPVISNISVAYSSSDPSFAQISWTTDIASNSQINYGVTTSYGTNTTLNSSLVTSHVQNITGLTANTTYHFRVRSGTAVSGDNTARVVQAVVTVGPLVGAVQSDAVIFSWLTDIGCSTRVQYGTTTSYGSATTLDSTQNTSHYAFPTPLTNNVLYHFRGIFQVTGYAQQVTSDLSYTILPVAVISNFVLTPIYQGMIVTWTTSVPATSLVAYGLGSLSVDTGEDATLVTSHSMTINGLTPGLYNFQARSKNSQSIETDSSEQQSSPLALLPAGPFAGSNQPSYLYDLSLSGTSDSITTYLNSSWVDGTYSDSSPIRANSVTIQSGASLQNAIGSGYPDIFIWCNTFTIDSTSTINANANTGSPGDGMVGGGAGASGGGGGGGGNCSGSGGAVTPGGSGGDGGNSGGSGNGGYGGAGGTGYNLSSYSYPYLGGAGGGVNYYDLTLSSGNTAGGGGGTGGESFTFGLAGCGGGAGSGAGHIVIVCAQFNYADSVVNLFCNGGNGGDGANADIMASAGGGGGGGIIYIATKSKPSGSTNPGIAAGGTCGISIGGGTPTEALAGSIVLFEIGSDGVTLTEHANWADTWNN